MANVVKTTFITDASQVFKTADAVEARYNKVEAKIKTASAVAPIPSAFAKQFNTQVDGSISRVQKLRDTLRETSLLTSQSNSPIWKSYSTGADMAAAKARGLYSEFKQLQIEASRATDPKLFASIQQRATATASQIDLLERKIERVTAGRVAAQSRIQSGGLGKYAGIASSASDYLSPEISKVVDLGQAAKAAGIISTAGIASVAAIAAIGYATIKWSESVKESALKRLKSEEKIAFAMSSQALAAKEINANFEKMLQVNIKDRAFGDFVNSAGLEDLQKRLANLQNLRKLGPVFEKDKEGNLVQTEQSLRTEKDILSLTDQVANAQKQNAATSNESYEQRFENIKKIQEAEREAEKKRQESIVEGIKKVKELQKEFGNVYQGLIKDAGANNPFVALFIDGESAIKKLREQTAGLNTDLQETFLNMQRTQNSLKLFETRLDTRLGAGALRDEAQRFRETPQARLTPEQQKDRRDAAFYRATQRGGFFGINDVDRASFSDMQRADIAGRSAFSAATNGPGNGFDLSRQGIGLAAYKLYQEQDPNADVNLSTQQRLDRQLEIITSAGAKTEAEKRIADKKLIGITQGLDPNSLTNYQREQAAGAREREAVRLEKSEFDSRKIAADMLEVNKEIDKNGKELIKLAQEQGIKGIESLITIRNEAGDAVGIKNNPNRPNNSDTQNNFHLDTVSGPGGLSNF